MALRHQHISILRPLRLPQNDIHSNLFWYYFIGNSLYELVYALCGLTEEEIAVVEGWVFREYRGDAILSEEEAILSGYPKTESITNKLFSQEEFW